MIAEPPVRRRPRTIFTATRVTAAIVVGVLALSLVPAGGHAVILVGYLALVLATCAALRTSRREPGSWLGRRSVRRVLVVLIGAVCLGLVTVTTSPTPTASAPSWLFGLLLVLVVLNVALGTATDRVASAPDTSVDERQEALRNRAHRLAYVILAVVVGGTIVVADVASPQSRAWLGSSLGGGGLFVFLELLFVLPAMVLAFIDPGYQPADIRDLKATRTRNRRARLAALLLALTIAVPVVLSVGLVVIPVRTTATVQRPSDAPGAPPPPGTPAAARSCKEFLATRDAGIGVEVRLTLHAEACWDGRRAVETFGMNASDCLMASSTMAIVTTTRCARTTSADGTLSFVYSSDVASAISPFLHRQITLEVVVDRNGTVERFP
jgi:hypothetical protein